MVFQRTKGRSVLTQPVGMPDLSGFKQAARSYQQLGSLVTQFGQDIRKRDYNEAIRQAEIDGKTAGTTYVKDENGMWKLQPLVNLDYSKSVQNLPKVDQKGVIDTYKEAAINAYVSAAVNDINSSANNALVNNKDKPGGVRSEMNGYIQGLKDELPEELFLELAPKVEAAFLSAENQAFAQQQKNADANSIANLEREFRANTAELGNMYAVGPNEGDDNSEAGFNIRVKEITDRDEQVLKSLSTYGVLESEIQAMRDNRTNAIAVRVGQSVIEKAYVTGGENGYTEALLTIEGILDDARSNPDIDEEKIRVALTITANSLERIKQANLTESSRIRESAYQGIIKRIVFDNESVVDMIVNQDPSLALLEPSQILSLEAQSRARSEQLINDEFTPAKDVIANWEVVLASQDAKAEQGIIQSWLKVRKLYDQRKIPLGDYLEVQGNFLKYFDHKVSGPNRNEVAVALKRELGPFSSYTISTENFIKRIPDLKSSGVIGEGAGAGWKDEDSYLTDVKTYKDNQEKNLKKSSLAQTASSKLNIGQVPTKEETDAYIKVFGFDKAVLPDGQAVKIDLNSQDESIFTASVDTAASFALNSKGVMLPEVVDLLNQSRFSPEATDKAVRVLGQTLSIMASQSDKPRYAIMYDLFEKNNLSEETRTYLTLANDVGISVAQEITKNPVDYNRDLNHYFSTRIKDGNVEQVADEFLMETFNKTLTMDVPFGVTNPVLYSLGQALGVNSEDPERNRFIQEFAATHNISVNDVNKIVLNNPVVRNSIKDLFYSRLLTHGKAVAPEQIMFSVLTSVGKRFGLEENQRTGQIEIVNTPILNEAQATVPMDIVDGRNPQPVVRLDHDMIVNDVVQSIMSVPGIAKENFYNALQEIGDGSNIRFHANDDMGGRQTYTVVLYDKIGVPYLLSENYRYDFQYSSQNQSYMDAIKEIKSSKVKNFLSLGGLMDRSLLQNTFEKWDESREPSSFNPLIKKVNEIYFALGSNSDYLRMDEEIEPFTTEEIAELWRLKETILSFGFK